MPEEKTKVAYTLFIIFILIFVAIASTGLLTPQPGDENTYYYMGKLITEGKVPYKDFFFAHPPLQIYLIAFIYRIFGFNIIALKLIPLISTLISAFFIFRITKEKFGNYAAIISSLLFFTITNFGVWAAGGFQLGISGLVTTLLAGVPFYNNEIFGSFFFNTIAGDFFYCGVLFGSLYLAKSKFPSLA